MSDLLDDPSYRAFLEDAAKDCACCEECGDPPCAGVLAGGVCDQFCYCERWYDRHDEGDELDENDEEQGW